MSSTFVADTTDDHKSDNTLIIIVNNDGTISVDQETLQNLIVNQQQNTAVSVVRVGASTQGDDSSQDSNGTCDSQNDGNPHVNLTVEGYYPPAPAPQSSTSEGPSEPLVDPFLEMDPEQLERLETALQSEQAKQILGENVTAMLDMLSVEEEKALLTDSIRMDHCYTNLSPSSAPTTSATPNHQYGPIGNSDTDTSDNSFEQEPQRQPVVTSSTPVQQPARTRGRGRGRGRPRKDASAVRSTQSSRGGAGRGSGRGAIRTARGGQTVSPGMVMLQQIKPINPPLAPPPTSPSSASLVPLIKPLVMTSDRHSQLITSTLAGTTINQGTVQKQVVAVPMSGGGTRLVTLTGTKLGQVVAGGQQRVLISANRTVPQQQQIQQIQQQQQGLQQEQKQQSQITSTGHDTTVTTTSNEESELPAQQDLVSSSVIAGMTAAAGQAKVLVAKMPTIPPQLLGSQPSTGLSEALREEKLPDDETDFTHFPGRDEHDELDASEDESEEELDPNDEDYIGPGGGSGRRRGRVGAKNRGNNRRPARGARTRGNFRSWDRGTGRGLGKVGVKRRGGRGRGGPTRPEDIERAQRLEAEMAAALKAMDQSPDRDSLMKSIGNERVAIDRIDISKIEEKQEGQLENLNSETVTPNSRKKVGKTNVKVSAKKKLTLTKELEGKVNEVIDTKKIPEKIATSPGPETKTAVKSPVRKHSTELSQTSSAVTSPTSTSTEAVKVENKKNYPKRENRKPPAHLAEALGPALFSTPDIIRRVSTGSEQKTPTSETSPVEAKKDTVDQPANMEETSEVNQPDPTPPAPSLAAESQNKEVSESAESDQPIADEPDTNLKIPEDHILQTEATKPEEQLLADAQPLLADAQPLQHIGDDASTVDTDSTHISKPMTVDFKPEESISSTNTEVMTPTPEVTSTLPSVKAAKQSAATPVTVTRSTRRRSSNLQEAQPKKEVARVSSQKQQQTQVKERRKSDENKTAQTKGQSSRSRSSEIDTKEMVGEDDEDSEAESSDDESWNSEDDPDRLWCICKKPHNNRFMICCDSCEDWFHGKCVGITKSIGKQMEEKGLEWCCPNCTKKKDAEAKEKERETKKPSKTIKEKEVKKASPKETPHKDIQKDNEKEIQKDPKEEHNKSSTEETVTSPLQKQPLSSSGDGVMFCIVCKKEARPTSIYCSDACILKHAQESLSLINKEKPSPMVTSPTAAQTVRNQTQALAQRAQTDQQMKQQSGPVSVQSPGGGIPLQKAKPEARVIVFERKTGRLLAGPNAPTTGNLKTWLKDNPTFEVVRPGVMPTTKFYNQKTAAQLKQAQNAKALQMQSKLVSFQPKPPPSPTKPSPTQTKSVAIQPKPSSNVVIVTKPQVVPVAGRGQKPATTSAPTTIVSREVVSKVATKVSHGVKSPTGTPKSVIKSTGNVTNTVHATKPVQGTMVPKVAATSTVKENAVNKNHVPIIIKKVEVKRSSSTSSTETPKKEEEKEKEKEKPPGPEPIRINVRKTLQELLQARIQECDDLTVAEEDVQKIALHIEEEMHTYFKDTGIKYKSKYRSLVFNIKDRKNLTLFRKIADKSVTPHQLVRLSPEELASQELAQWREREAKHQLEMIKKNELDLMALSKTYVMKTHKGEQVIETDESMKTHVPELVDASAVPDLVSALNNSVSSTVEDSNLEQDKVKTKDKGKEGKDREKRREDKDRKSKDRDKSSKREERKKDVRVKEHSKDKEGSRHQRHRDSSRSGRDGRRSRERGKSSTRSKHHHHHHGSSERDRDRSSRKERHEESKKADMHTKKEDSKKIIKEEIKVAVDNRFEEEEKKIDTKVENEDKIKVDTFSEVKVEEDSDMSDREPSSTVIIKTPDIDNIDDTSTVGAVDTDKGLGACVNVWKGFVNMPDVAKFFTSVQVVSGDSQNLCKDLPDTVDIVGRIIPETVWDYISKMKKSGTKEILVIRLTAANDEEKIPYITLYTYLNIRNRFGVVGNVSKMIKDFYIMPLASHNPVPQVLLPLDGPGFEDYRPHLLIGILVRARRKRLAPELTYVAKVPKRPPALPVVVEAPERSYTPPLPGTVDDIGSLTPPHPPPNLSTSEGYTPPHSPKHSSYETNTFQNTDPRLMRKTCQDVSQDTCISEEQSEEVLQPEKVTSVTVPPNTTPKFSYTSVDDDDAPYSPGGGVEDSEVLGEDNLLDTPKNSNELQRKMDELNRRIEEQKQQIQSISSAMVGSDAVGGSTVAVSGVEPLQVPTMMQSFMIEAGDEANKPESPAEIENEDENEAYSPSRSFTPPTSDSIPLLGEPNDPTPSVLSALSSNLSLPSNLSEILASIKKREIDNSNSTTGSTKSMNLKEDPIVQNYTIGRTPNDVETMKAENDGQRYMPQEDEVSSHSSTSYLSSSIPNVSTSTLPFLCDSPDQSLNSASSIVPALLSLSTPVIHPLTVKTDPNVNRDPRQKQTDSTKSMTLSFLTDDNLIKKAMEMELGGSSEKQNSMTNPSLQQPLPPGVDNFPVLPTSAAPPPGPPPPPPPPPPLSPAKLTPAPLKSLPSGQPLPPGLEDEEYPTYSSSYAPPHPHQTTATPHTVQPLVSPSQIAHPPPPPPQSVSYSVRHPPPPVSFHIPPPNYNPPPPAYNIGPPSHAGSPQGGSYTSSYVSAAPVLYSGSASTKTTTKPREEPAAMLRNKRKFQDMEDNIPVLEKRESSGSGQGREHWDKKPPVPMQEQYVPHDRMRPRGRFNNPHHAPRTYFRNRGGRNGPPHRGRWGSRNSQDFMNNKRKSSRYDTNIRSEWDSHIKDFEEKQRERTREFKQRGRERERERPSSSRSYSSSRSSKSRRSENGSDDSS